MIVRGFFEQVVSQLPSARIKAAVLGALSGRIGSEADADGGEVAA
jgi:Fe-S cluster assembly scaffold protein SufB